MLEQILIRENGDVFLTLPKKSYKRRRNIGKIANRTLFTFRHSGKNQIYRHSNSINFNYHLLSNFGHCFDLICVNLEGGDYWTSRQKVLKSGKFISYKNNGLDKQIGLNIYQFKRSRDEAVKEMTNIVEESEAKIAYEKAYRAAGVKAKVQQQPEFQFA